MERKKKKYFKKQTQFIIDTETNRNDIAKEKKKEQKKSCQYFEISVKKF